jgi:predicted MFS family arabinose efflux permease
VGLNLGPVLGLLLFRWQGGGLAFAVAGGFGLLAATGAALTRQMASARQQRAPEPLLSRIVERRALLSALLIGLSMISFVPLSTYMPLSFRALGLEGVEWYFLGVGLSGTLARVLTAGRVDQLGRFPSMVVGFVLELAGLALLPLAGDLTLLVVSGVLFQLGGAIVEPTLYALVVDRTPEHRRGVAMATCTSAFQAGDGIGSPLWGYVIEHFGHRAMHLTTWVPTALGLGVVLATMRGRDARQ